MSTLTRHWTNHANRGKWLETAIESSAETALKRGEGALVKLATPYVLPEGPDGTRRITRQRSTVDFIGQAGGVPVAFDAKAVHLDRLPLSHVQQHQVQFLVDFKRAGGVGALLVAFGAHRAYLCDVLWWIEWERLAKAGGRKSVRVEAFRQAADSIDRVAAVVAGARGYALDWPGAVVSLALSQETRRVDLSLGGAR